MNRTRKLLKKVIAVAAASSLIAAGGSTVMAAGSYQEAETAAYDKFVSGVASSWEEYLASYQTAQKGSNAKKIREELYLVQWQAEWIFPGCKASVWTPTHPFSKVWRH